MTGIENQGCRESAEKVFIDRAERLEERALAYRMIAQLIRTNGLTDDDDSNLWSFACSLGV